jgi:hypothetical protein
MIRLTAATLYAPTPWAAIRVEAAAVVIVIAVMVAVIPIRGCWNRAADCDCAENA